MRRILKMNGLKRFWRANSGLAAVEFAFILPVMVIMFLGTVEVSNYVTAARRVASISSTGADLSAQEASLTNAEMNDIFGALTTIMDPLKPTIAKIRISSVVADANGTTYRIAWSDARNDVPRVVGSIVSAADFPAGLLAAFQGAIMCEVSYAYDPMFSNFLSGVTLKDKFYLKPRKSLTVLRTP
jgi:Flp pilus assembly protein TadG